MLTVIILTKNESLHLQRAIESVASIASQIIVVDSYSTDKTVEVAKAMQAEVWQNPFVNQAVQFNWALDNVGIRNDWILRLDADEIVERDLQSEIKTKLPLLPQDVVAINLKRKHIFMGRWIKYGGRFPLLMTRLFRAGCGRSEDRWMDEHIVVTGGKTVTFNGGFADHNLNDLTYFIQKHNHYATREAIEVLNQKYQFLNRPEPTLGTSGSFTVARKRFIKESIYNRIPFTVSSTIYFIFRFVFQFGFLDGRVGLVYHFLQGYWYRFLVGAKVMEFERAIAGLKEQRRMCEVLASLTGFRLEASDSSIASLSADQDL